MKEASSRPTTAAIGDGANDVSMIREAHVGLGIVLVSSLLSFIGQGQYNVFLRLSGLLKQNRLLQWLTVIWQTDNAKVIVT